MNNAARLVKRAILANIATDKENVAITPLISGKHGIGKSAIVKSVAKDLGGTCITIEGGTLKEGEITGLPYQYENAQGEAQFKFLPYYAVERIQEQEKLLFEQAGKTIEENDVLSGTENRYAQNDLAPQEKIDLLLSGKVKPVIIFVDEINRTDNTVYKELMNILLTKTVNGYQFPWWVFFVGAMNPSTQNSVYATNEMDPAQLDRFLKLKVTSNTSEWIRYGKKTGISPAILQFIKENPKCLSESAAELDDEEKPTPSPRGWDMVDTILSSEPLLQPFFTAKENSENVVAKDMKELVAAKLGGTVATMYFASLVENVNAFTAEEVFADDEKLSTVAPAMKKMPVAKRVQTCDAVLGFLEENLDFLILDTKGFSKMKQQLSTLISVLDASTKLLFAQKIAAGKTAGGDDLIEVLFDVFEQDLLEMLDLSDATRKAIQGSK
ncbi:MAG: AAA family ATPase [Ellagibacter isourolithinifaciens]|uniref:AAA family ATPase n=1 Tax=Ellagibacter isourolithinifaciens TaxID=2137581 RepID=UPI002E79231F|nr:AAA family ATPase [Ellagibacter isourolithinifaciens]MEE1454711.1 AAA family ATPase [Ellagibacter isourolithinifaciens]